MVAKQGNVVIVFKFNNSSELSVDRGDDKPLSSAK